MARITSIKKGMILFFIFMQTLSVSALPEVTILDESHYSHVFAETRHYRIFLPPGYASDSPKKYPVIYFLHGWSQRYFGSGADRYAEYDRGNDNGGENFENYVAAHEVIIVKSDGYNRAGDEDYYLRPYNIGPVENYRQFPIYFPELINHIDATYRTLANRENRAIAGLSMGGFMSFVIGGKYPHLFAGVGNFCGSPEFFIGPREMPVEYRHMDMYKNYSSSKVRLHYGDKDFIRAYHEDLNRIWPAVQENYSFRIYPGEHSTTGMNDMLDFLLATMKSPLPKPDRWDHIDLYPSFDVWNYKITSDRKMTGYTVLENVDRNGFKIGVKSWLPDGEWQPWVNVTVITDAIYEKNTAYLINDCSLAENRFSTTQIMSDSQGRLKIVTDGARHMISVVGKNGEARPSIAGVHLQSQPWIFAGQEQSLLLRLVNNGNHSSGKIRVKISSPSKNVQFRKSEISFSSIPAHVQRKADDSFKFTVNNEPNDVIRFEFSISNGKSEWTETADIPVRKNVPLPESYVIADGKVFTVYKSGTDIETISIGKGNGDGVVNPGELIEVLVKDKEYHRRVQLFPYGDADKPGFGYFRLSDYWGNYDNVGGSAKYTPVLIPGSLTTKRIRFLAEYWLPEKPNHHIRQGIVELEVNGEDHSGPMISWLQVTAGNTIQTRIQDGSPIKRVRVRGFLGRTEMFNAELNDAGNSGDGKADDSVYSIKMDIKEFGFYRLLIEAEDVSGNSSIQEMPEKYVFHR